MIVGGSLDFFVTPVFAQTANELQKTIDAKNAEIQALQNEVNHYQTQVSQIQDQANTLKGTLNVINTNQKRLQNNLQLTNKKTEKTTLVIEQNEDTIADLGQGISQNSRAIAEMMRSVHASDERSLLEMFISRKSISKFVQDVDEVKRVQERLSGTIDSMQSAKSNLEHAQDLLAQRKKELETLSGQIQDQKKLVDVQAQEKKVLLDATKDKESEYQKLLTDRKKKIAALEAELFDYESKLKFTLNPTSLPADGAQVLSWPVDSVTITQRFGATVDARRLYVSGSHSGVDFRAAVGTPVYAVASGTIEGTGDTDKTCPKASFGKWIFIKHTNGLSTAYGHLSLIKVSEGQKVSTGDLIGYSGNTGHSTAPHLHLTVYATNGVEGQEGARVADRPSQSCSGKTYRMPIAPTNAYLDPLLYLPKTTSKMFK